MPPSEGSLLGFRTERLGGLADAAEGFLEGANKLRYGMGEQERSQLIGRLPGSPPYGPEAERYTSSYLFSQQNPGLAHLFGPAANAASDAMYGTNFAEAAARGREAGASQRQSEQQGGPNLQSVVQTEQDKRNAAAQGPQPSVDVTTSDFRVDPNVTNPAYAVPSFLTVPTLPEKPSTFDDAFDDFSASAREGGGYSLGDPFTPGDQLPSDIGAPGSVDTGTYDNREGLPEFDGNGDCVANCGPAPESGMNPAALTPEEQDIVDRDRQDKLRDIYGQDPVLKQLVGGMGSGGTWWGAQAY